MASDAAPPDLIWNPNQPPLPSNDDLWDSPVVCAPVLHINLNYAEPEYRLQFTQTLRERVPQAAVLDIRAHQPTGNAPIPPTVLLSPPHPYEPIRDWFPAFQNFKRRNPGCARYTIIFLDDVHNPHFPYSAEARAVLETYLAPLVLFAAAERRCLIPIHIMGQRHLVFQAAHRTLGPTATEFEVKFWVHRMERQMHSIASTLANTSNRRWLYPNEDEFEMVAVTIRTQYIQWAAQWHCARTTRLDWLRGNGCLPAFIADRVARLVITLWDFKSILKMISYPEGEFGPVMELECKILQQLSGNKQTVLDATIRWLKGIFQYEKNVYVGWVEEEEVTRKRMQCDCQMTALARCMEDVGAWMRDVRIQTQGELHVFEKDLTMNMTWMHRLEELIPRLWEAAVVKKVEYDLDPRRSGDESSSDYDLSSGSDDAADEVDTTEENSHEDNPSDDNNMQDGNPVASDTVQGGLEGENNELTASGEWEDQQPDTTGTNLGPEHPSDDSNMQDEDPVASETVHGGHEHEMDESTASDERENQQPPQPGSTCGKKRKQNSMEGLDALLDHLERQMQDDGDMPGDRPEPDSTPMAQDTSGSTSEDCSQGECKKRCLGLARSEESTEQSSPMDGAGDDSPSLQPEQSEEATDQSSLVNGDENDPPSSQPEQSEEATERSNLVDGDENYPPSLQTKQSAPVNYAWRPTFAIELFTRRPSKGSYREYPLHYQEGMPTPSPLRISVSADDILPEADEPAFGQCSPSYKTMFSNALLDLTKAFFDVVHSITEILCFAAQGPKLARVACASALKELLYPRSTHLRLGVRRPGVRRPVLTRRQKKLKYRLLRKLKKFARSLAAVGLLTALAIMLGAYVVEEGTPSFQGKGSVRGPSSSLEPVINTESTIPSASLASDSATSSFDPGESFSRTASSKPNSRHEGHCIEPSTMAPQSVDPEDSPAFFEKLTRSHIDSIFSESEGTGSHSTTSEPIVNSTTVTSHSSPAIPHVQLFDLRRREIPSRITSESHEPTYSDDGTASLTTIDHTCSTAPTSREESPVHNIELWGVPNSLVIPTAALQYHEQQHDDGGWAKKLKEPGMADCTYPRDYLPSDRPFHEPPSFPRTRASSCTESEVGHLPPVTKTGKGDRTISRDYFPNDRPFHEPPSFPRTRTSSCTEPETSNLPPTEPTAIPEWTFLPGLGQQPLEEAIPSFPTPVPANAETVLPTAPVSGFNNPALYPRPRPATTGVKVRKAPAAVSEYRALQVYLAEYQQAAVVYAQHIKLVYQTVLERTRKECEDGLLGGCSALRNLAGMVKSLETLVRMADARVEAVEWVSHALLAHLEVEGKGGSGGC